MTGTVKRNYGFRLTALFLILALMLELTLNSFAEGSEKYVGDIKLFIGETMEEALGECKAAGYIPLEEDLNDGSDGFCVLGYTETYNTSEAIRDLTVLEMNNGYTILKYEEIAEKQMEKMSAVSAKFVSAIAEFKAAYSDSAPGALQALEILNLYTIPELSGICLGDYLLSDSFSENFLRKILCRASSAVTFALSTALSAAVADYAEDEEGRALNWVTESLTSAARADLEAEQNYAALDNLYKEDAAALADLVNDFYENYTAAKAYVDAEGYESLASGENEGDWELSDEARSRVTDAENSTEESDSYFLYLCAYELLNAWSWDENTRFGDYFLSLGETSYTTVDTLRALYPLAEGLSEGQLAMAEIAGLPQIILNLYTEGDSAEVTASYLTALKQEIAILKSDGTACLSVWDGVDLTIYEEEVALTSEAQRQMDAANSYDELTKGSAWEEGLDIAMTKVGIASSVISLMTLVTGIVYALPVFVSEGFAEGAAAALASKTILTTCFKAGLNICTNVLAGILGWIGTAVVVVSYIILAAMLIILLVKLFTWIVSLLTPEREAEALDYSVSDIPLTLYDYRSGDYVKYTAVTDGHGSASDLNAFEGLRFAALYVSRDPAAGEPLRVPDSADAFLLKHNNAACPEGYTPVPLIGGSNAENLNFYADEADADQLYLFFTRENVKAEESGAEGTEAESGESEAEGTEAESGENAGTSGEETVLYLSDLELSVEATPTAAKNKLVKRGFEVIDYNLTPDAVGSAAYLGYKTTSNPANAIRDIRVSPRTDGGSITFGQCAYVLAGDTTQSGLGIYFAVGRTSGTPIYANLLVTSDRADCPEGWEPVNMFSGGAAYNLNDNSDKDSLTLTEDCWENGVYLFFEPTEKFTSGTKYLGGLTMVMAEEWDSVYHPLSKLLSAYGYQLLSTENISEGFEVYALDDETLKFRKDFHYGTFLAYSETFNPYRAIYGLRSYTAAPQTDSLTISLGSASSGAYVVCDTLFQVHHGAKVGLSRDSADDVYTHGVSANHSYLNIGNFGGELAEYYRCETGTQTPEDFETVSWTCAEEARLKGLYVQGPVSGAEPLTVSDLLVSSDSSEENHQKLLSEGYSSVQDFRTPNRTEPHSLGYGTLNPKYLYVKRTAQTAGKYIKAISVVSWNAESALRDAYGDYSEEQLEQIDLMADNICVGSLISQVSDEILPLNLAVSYEETWQADPENAPRQVAYIGVTRTDNVLEAVRSVIRFTPEEGITASSTIKVGGVTYTRAGDEPVHDAAGDYYLYYSAGIGGSPGEPVTELCFDSTPIIKNQATALTASKVDVSTVTKTKTGRSKTVWDRAKLSGNVEGANYLHMEFESGKSYIDALYVGSGATEREAAAELLSMGCNMIVPIDLNQDAGGTYVYLGYTRFSVGTGFATTDDAVRDVICTVGKAAEAELEVNGMTYTRAWDRYSWNREEGAVSLNEGTGGRAIYIYYTCESFEGAESPIMNLGAHTRDFIPDNQGEYIWESVLASDDSRCNVNDGVFGTGEDGHSIDSRIYLFVNRKDNSVKPGADCAVGNTASSLRYGSMKFTE